MDFSREQKAIIYAPQSSQQIIAGPGSGKTRALTERIIYFIEKEHFTSAQILGLTFSVKANLELRKRLFARLQSLSAAIELKTFHALALKIVKTHCPAYAQRRLCVEQKIKLRIVEEAISPFLHLPLFPKEFKTPEMALWNSSLFKRQEIDRYLHPKETGWKCILTKAIQQNFQDHNFFLFDDLCVDALKLLRNNPKVQQRYHKKWPAIFVDEFQDLTPLQFKLLEELCHSQTTITTVGDSDQAIFAWRGGDHTLLQKLQTLFPNIKEQTLSQNFRCPQKIVFVANFLIQKNTLRASKSLHSTKEGGRVQIERYQNEKDELQACAERIYNLLKNDVPPNEIAALCRNLDMVQALHVALHSLGIPVAGENPLYTSEGKQILSLLHFVLSKKKLSKAINVGKRRMRQSFYQQLTQKGEDLEKSIRNLIQIESNTQPELTLFIEATDTARNSNIPLYERLKQLFQSLSLPSNIQENPIIMNLIAAQRLILELSKQYMDLQPLLDELELIKTYKEDLSDHVSILTLHKAKGLEFNYVSILGNQNNIFPHYGLVGNDTNAIEEERRLLYVGLTRTKKEVFLSNHSAPQNNHFTHKDGFLSEIFHLCEI